jgi:uncharacterized membrane protein (DUF441 family)
VKTKDLMLLCVAVLILLVSGYIGYTQFVAKKGTSASKTVQVEVIGSIPSQLDQSGMAYLNNSSKVADYDTPIDMSGLNNNEPFGP